MLLLLVRIPLMRVVLRRCLVLLSFDRPLPLLCDLRRDGALDDLPTLVIDVNALHDLVR